MPAGNLQLTFILPCYRYLPELFLPVNTYLDFYSLQVAKFFAVININCDMSD